MLRIHPVVFFFLFLMIIAVVGTAAGGCEGDSISRCGYACEATGHAMQKYNKTDGCLCGDLLPKCK